jgi:D-amino-acid dehydrogenase
VEAPASIGEPRHATVIGAGIVGVCCALALLEDGHRVTLLDADEPGRGASFGNAGFLSGGSVMPHSSPGLIRRVPRMLLDPLGPLTIRWRHLPRLTPWLLRFLAAGRLERVERIAAALQALYATTVADFAPLVREAGCADLIEHRGRLELYASDASFDRSRLKRELMRRHGVRFEELDAAGVREREPALRAPIRHGLWFPDEAHTVDPFRLTQALAENFRRRGGTFRRVRVRGFALGEGGPTALHTDAGDLPADLVVLAAGISSRALAARLGSRVPLESERGYHVSLPHPGVAPRVPFASTDHGFVITPMGEGIRLAGTIELASLQAPPNWARADKLLRIGRLLLGDLNEEGAQRWMGHRPAMPDSLPVIGRSPLHPRVLFAFGHGHLGLTGAPHTGRLIAQLAGGRPPGIDLAPFRPDRF